MLLSNEVVSATLSVHSEVVVFKLIPSQALVSASVDVVENGHGEAGESADVHLVGC